MQKVIRCGLLLCRSGQIIQLLWSQVGKEVYHGNCTVSPESTLATGVQV